MPDRKFLECCHYPVQCRANQGIDVYLNHCHELGPCSSDATILNLVPTCHELAEPSSVLVLERHALWEAFPQLPSCESFRRP